MKKLLTILLISIPLLNVYAASMLVEVSLGELLDKITILRIKKARIHDPEKLHNIYTELSILENTLNNYCTIWPALQSLIDKLQAINLRLWDIEDAIRDQEYNQKFGAEFIDLARSVYFVNDERCAVKREINALSGSFIQEEKSYTEYKTGNQPRSACIQ